MNKRAVTKYFLITSIVFLVSVGGVWAGIELSGVIPLVGGDSTQPSITNTTLIAVGGTAGVLLGSLIFGFYWLFKSHNHGSTESTAASTDPSTTQGDSSSQIKYLNRRDLLAAGLAIAIITPVTGPLVGISFGSLVGLLVSTVLQYSWVRLIEEQDDHITGSEKITQTSSTNTDTQSTEDHRAAAEEAIEVAVTAKSNDNIDSAVTAYKKAISKYQAALDALDAGSAEERAEIENTIESLREKLDATKTRHEQREVVIESLQAAERSLQEAIIAFVEDNGTIARIRFRQARDSLSEAREIMNKSDNELLTSSIQLRVEPDRELSSNRLAELPVISEAEASELDDAGIKTVDNLDSKDESPWIPPKIAELAETETVDDEFVTALTVLSWWHGDDSYEFDSTESVERRQQQADYGFNQAT